jgi:cytochrome c biogenesis protein CcmG/thiol:disulfide interchange protein DsbE
MILLAWTALAVAGTAPPDPAVQARRDAALGQVELWWDLGELGKADAVTRRAVKGEADVAWHLARLETLTRAGMTDWIDAEYVERHLEGVAAEAWAIWQWRADPTRTLPSTAAGAVERVRAALAAKDTVTARAALEATPLELRPGLRLAVEVAAGDVEQALGVAGVLLADTHVDLALLAPLWDLPDARKVRAAQADALSMVDRRAAAEDVLPMISAARLALAIPDPDRLEALAVRVDALTTSADASVRTLHFDPDTLDDFDVPRRGRWNQSMLVSAARLVARQDEPQLPWGRPDELGVMARELASELERTGRVEEADVARSTWLGACEPTGDALRFARSNRRGDARDRAEQDLWGCLGVLDLEPDEDPANVNVGEAISRAARAWEAFAAVSRELGYLREAALGTGVAAWLQPTTDRVSVAKADTAKAAFEADDLGLPTVKRLLAELDEAAWLRPAEALDARRAGRTAARTAALLSLEPERLVAAMTPESACVPPLRSRCQVEAAVAEAAYERAHRVLPDGFHPATDPGARRAAARVLGALEAERFSRTSALAGVTGTTGRLATVLEKPGVREGMRAPSWSVGDKTGEALHGKAVIVAFWASWCAPCRVELPALEALAGRWAKERLPVEVFAVDLDEDEAKYRKAMAELDFVHLDVVRDLELGARFDVRELPTLVLMDRDGIVRDIRVGWDDRADEIDALVRAFASP